MWSKISYLLGIKVSDNDYDAHVDELMVTTAWVQQHYPAMTCEEIVHAYDLACTHQLKIKELFSLLTPKHIGIVLNAYLHYTENDLEINRVFSQQLLIEPPPPTPEQISELMEWALGRAIEDVRAGKFYYDAGNGLFDWLWAAGRIVMTDDQKADYWSRANKALPKLLERERSTITAGDVGKVSGINKLIQEAEAQKHGRDLDHRVEAYAKRLALNDYLKTLP